MAEIVAFVPDLLFGSNVASAVTAAGHQSQLVSKLAPADLDGADAVIVDLTTDAPERLGAVAPAVELGLPTLAFYSHVEVEVRRAAEAAGIGIVVPRSRMAREGPALVELLLSGRAG